MMNLEILFNKNDLLDLMGKICIPLVIGYITYAVAKKNINAAGVTQFRQKWIDNLRESISLFITQAEMISILPFEEEVDEDEIDEDEYEIIEEPTNEDPYYAHFKELIQMQHKIELLLNPNEDDHNEIVNLLEEIRIWVHEQNVSEEVHEEKLEKLIKKLMDVTKRVLKREWSIVKKGK